VKSAGKTGVTCPSILHFQNLDQLLVATRIIGEQQSTASSTLSDSYRTMDTLPGFDAKVESGRTDGAWRFSEEDRLGQLLD